MAVAGAHPLLAPPVHLAEVRVVAEPEHEVRPHGADRREDAVVATVGRAGPVVGRVVDVEARADGGGEVRGVGAPLPERLRLELRRVRPHRRHAVDEDVVAVARARLQLGEVERGDVVVLGRRSEDGCDAGGGGPGAPRLGRRVAELHVRRPRRLHPYGHLAVRDVAEHRPGLQRLRPLRDGDGRRRGDVARGVRPRAGRLQHRAAGEEDEQRGGGGGGGGACGCGAWRGRCGVASTTHAPPSPKGRGGARSRARWESGDHSSPATRTSHASICSMSA